MSQYTVFGNPIAQSKSPAIHHMFAEQVGLTIEYNRTLAKKDDFIQVLEAFFLDSNAMGCNVTSPFKEQVAQWVSKLSVGAELAQAVNTVIRQPDGTFLGDTTDGPGLIQDLLRLGITVKDKRILLLGAGGAARGVLQSILSLEPALLVIANRTESKAKLLCSLLPQDNFTATGFTGLDGFSESFDLIINSTSTGLTGELPPISDNVIAQSVCVYDMSYGDKPTTLMQHAKKLGVTQTFDGLGMLVGQAAESFYLWTGLRPDVEPVIKVLRNSL